MKPPEVEVRGRIHPRTSSLDFWSSGMILAFGSGDPGSIPGLGTLHSALSDYCIIVFAEIAYEHAAMFSVMLSARTLRMNL